MKVFFGLKNVFRWMDNMAENIKMAAVDIDGTFVRSDYTYDVPHFKRILSHMKKEGCNFVVASGNQYYQLRDFFLDIMMSCHLWLRMERL